MRSLGIEEELLVVDTETGRPRAVAARVLDTLSRAGDAALAPGGADDAQPGGTVGGELQQQMLETDTSPHTSLVDIEDDLRRWRDAAAVAARHEGAGIIAAGTSPMPATPQVVADPRFQQMLERFGPTAAEQLTCGCHVHVSVTSDDEGVAAMNRIRVWLPVLLAISGNSPFWQGDDTRHASFRSQVLARWPSSGPPERYASGAAYRESVADMVASGVLLDQGMLYTDARLSHRYPTLEIRAADVCLNVRDAVLVGALCRALVDTAAAEWTDGRPAPEVPVLMLRLATWQAAREGVNGSLLDPVTYRPRPAGAVLDDLVVHVGLALEANGDAALVEERLEQVRLRGNGAIRQRAVLDKTSRRIDVVAELIQVTAGRGD